MIALALESLRLITVSVAAASPADVARIQALMDRANQLYEGVEVKPGESYGILPAMDEIEKEKKSVNPSLTVIALQEESLQSMLEEEASLRTIIAEVKRAYGITPDKYLAPLTAYRFKGELSTWDPKFGEHATRRLHQKRNGKKVVMIFNEDYAAVTWENGEIILTRRAFRSPGFLAAAIYHETVHFNQFTNTDPKQSADNLTRRQIEFRAYITARNPKFGLTEEEKHRFYREFRKVIDSGDADRKFNPFLGGAPLKTPSEDLEAVRREAARTQREAAKRRRDQHLSNLREIAEGLCRNVIPTELTLDSLSYVEDRSFYREAENEYWKNLKVRPDCEWYPSLLSNLAAHGRLELWMLRTPGAEPVPAPREGPTAPRVPPPWELPQAAKPDVPMDGERDLLRVVSRACADPGRFREASLPDLSWFPAPRPLRLMQPRDSLTPCEIQLWDSLLARNAQGLKLDLENLAQQAYGFQYRPPARPDVPYNKCIDPGNKCIPGIGR